MKEFIGINITLRKQRSLTYVATLPDRKCPITQPGGMPVPDPDYKYVAKLQTIIEKIKKTAEKRLN